MRILILAAALLAATAQAAPVPPDANAAIDKANADWLPAMTAHDAARIAEPYADDAAFIFPDGRSLQGLPAIRAMLDERMARLGVVEGGGLASDGRVMEGNLIYEWGHGAIRVRAADGTVTAPPPGPYLTVWKRGAGGRWRIIRNLIF